MHICVGFVYTPCPCRMCAHIHTHSITQICMHTSHTYVAYINRTHTSHTYIAHMRARYFACTWLMYVCIHTYIYSHMHQELDGRIRSFLNDASDRIEVFLPPAHLNDAMIALRVFFPEHFFLPTPLLNESVFERQERPH